MRKLVSILLTLCLVLSVPVAANAAPVGATGSIDWCQAQIAAGSYHSAWLIDTGVRVVGRCQTMNQLDPAWDDVVKIVGYHQLFGLKSDGTVIVTGEGPFTNDHFAHWRNIVDIDVNECDVIGLQADGTVVMRGYQDDLFMEVLDELRDVADEVEEEVEEDLEELLKKPVGIHIGIWEDMVDVAQGTYATYGLHKDGTVWSMGLYGNADSIYGVWKWKDIMEVDAGQTYVAGLKNDGTVVLAGGSSWADMDTSGWSDIIAISAGANHLVGLRSDGTVVATGYNNHGQCDVAGLTDVVAVSAGFFHTMVMTASGEHIAIGSDDNGQCRLGGAA